MPFVFGTGGRDQRRAHLFYLIIYFFFSSFFVIFREERKWRNITARKQRAGAFFFLRIEDPYLLPLTKIAIFYFLSIIIVRTKRTHIR